MLLLGALLIACGFLAFSYQYRQFTIDDAFISLRYSENLVRGAGLVYNPGERVEGYTNFAWVILIAAAHAAGLDSLTAAKVLGTLFDLGTLALLIWVTARWWPRSAFPGFPLVPAALLAVNAGFIYWGVGGLETAMFVFLVTAGLIRLVHEASVLGAPAASPDPGTPAAPGSSSSIHRTFPIAAVLFALATLTRPDGAVLFAGGLAGWGLWILARRRLSRPLVGWWLRSLTAYAAIVGAHLAFRYLYYGAWVPNTVSAKIQEAAGLQIHWTAVTDWLRPWGLIEAGTVAGWFGVLPDVPWWASALSALTCPAAPLVVIGLAAMRRHVQAWIGTGAIVVWLVYLAWILPDWMPGWRYYLPITPLVILLMAGGFEHLIAWIRRTSATPLRWVLATGVGLGWAGLLLLSYGETERQLPNVAAHAFIVAHSRAAGLYLRAHAPSTVTLAVMDAGAIPYYSGLYTIDYGGLADKHMAQVPYRPFSFDKGDGVVRHYPGLRSDTDYLIARQPDFVQLSGRMLPDGRNAGHSPELALVYQALLKEGSYDLAHPVLYDEPVQLIIVKRQDSPWRP